MRLFKMIASFFLVVMLLFSLAAAVLADSVEMPPPTTESELILARGVDGTRGYVRASDLEEPMPESPEAALALQAQRRASGYVGHYINLYASDGVTVIGCFFIGVGDEFYDLTGVGGIASYTSRLAVCRICWGVTSHIQTNPHIA